MSVFMTAFNNIKAGLIHSPQISPLIITAVYCGIYHKFEDRKTDEEKEIKDTAAVQLQHIMRTHVHNSLHEENTLSQWTLEGREGKKMRGEMGWDKLIYGVREGGRENWRESELAEWWLPVVLETS